MRSLGQDRDWLSAKGLCGRVTKVRVELTLTMKLNITMLPTMAMNMMVIMNMTMMLMMTMTLTRVMVEFNRVEKPGSGQGLIRGVESPHFPIGQC